MAISSLFAKLALVLVAVLLADHVAFLALPKLAYGFFPAWCWLLPTKAEPEATSEVRTAAEPRLEPRLFP